MDKRITIVILISIIAVGFTAFKITAKDLLPIEKDALIIQPTDSKEYKTAKVQLIQRYEDGKKTGGTNINDFFSIIGVMNKEIDKLKNMPKGLDLFDQMIQQLK